MAKPLFSIIVPVFEDPTGLRKTLQSLLEQGFGAKEILVIDGGSGPEMQALLAEYRADIQQLVSEKDEGVYDAMNKGYALATGDYALILNAGDTLAAADVLEKVSHFAGKAPLLYAASRTYFEAASVLRYADFESEQPDWYRKKLPNHQAIWIHRALYTQYRYSLRQGLNADTQLLLQLFERYPALEMPFVHSHFPLGGRSNYYPSFRHAWSLTAASYRLRGMHRQTLGHLPKYLLQRLLGRRRYLHVYLRYLLRR
ncbi:glycosyltransferase, group 2 family protein [Nitritalea halalkaliphila LW7]|uniref:Glycosyltransferase, group 2 family protein n=1 Tax=Nitritalea halalkaliphila LW7 TaxID=1189621 RepID=I5BUL5_9BACT|nr:glycosyltransferase [Nitritalea halalkaliphila]EIM73267.1 glycosyltransferase, group 2 family protein [Nitritalea halalkaliphila LW7]